MMCKHDKESCKVGIGRRPNLMVVILGGNTEIGAHGAISVILSF